MEPRAQEELSLRDYVAPLVARRWLILGIVLLATAAVYAYYARQEKVYQTSTKLYVAQEANPLIGAGGAYSDDRSVENQATLLTSEDVSRAVAKKIGFKGEPSGLASRVTAVPAGGADFITITARGRTGEEAAAISNGFAQAFIDVRSADRREQINKALDQLRKQLNGIPRRPENATERADVASRIRQLKVASSSAPGNAQQIDPAQPPSAPIAPKPVNKALLAFPLALLGSILLAYLLSRLDPRLRSVEEAASIYRRPVLASVIHDDGIAHFDNGLPTMSAASRETFRELRVNLDLAALDKPFRTIVVTSAGAGEGKSTVARNLALALHEAGRRVALVDADLRKPTLPDLLAVKPNGGLTDVLAGERSLDEALTAVDVESRGVASLERMASPHAHDYDPHSQNGHSSNALTFLASGPQPPNPPAVLESAAAASLLLELADRYEVVVIDTAPLLVVSDAIPLLGRADAALLVARSGITDRRSAHRAAEILGRIPNANLAGIVVNDLSGSEASAYGTRYGYGAAYGSQSATSRSESSPAAKA